MKPPRRLSDFPYVRVRIACTNCPRKGSYRLARLAASYGPEMELDLLLERLSLDCHVRRAVADSPARYGDFRCGAHFFDLAGSPRPPDLPASTMRLRVVKGGR
jgi:hypothetical protein